MFRNERMYKKSMSNHVLRKVQILFNLKNVSITGLPGRD